MKNRVFAIIFALLGIISNGAIYVMFSETDKYIFSFLLILNIMFSIILTVLMVISYITRKKRIVLGVFLIIFNNPIAGILYLVWNPLIDSIKMPRNKEEKKISQRNKQLVYDKAKTYIETDKLDKLHLAIRLLKVLDNYSDSEKLILSCKKRIKEINKKYRIRNIIIISSIITTIAIIICGIIINSKSAHKMVFDTRGGSEIEIAKYYKNETIIVPTNPTKEGYAFVGWNKEIPDKMPARKVIVRAIWQKTETIFEEEGRKYIYYGEYYQDKVVDENLLEKLKNTKPLTNNNDYNTVEYGGSRYMNAIGNYYLISPLKWMLIDNNGSGYIFICDTVIGSLYETSDPDTFLNTKFLNFAFTSEQQELLFMDEDKHKVNIYGTEDQVEDFFFYAKASDYAYDLDLEFDLKTGYVNWYIGYKANANYEGDNYFYTNVSNKLQTASQILNRDWGLRPCITLKIDNLD